MAILRKLSMAIAGAVFSSFSLGPETAHTHGEHLPSDVGHSQSDSEHSPSSIAPHLDSDSIFYGDPQPLGDGYTRVFVTLDDNGNPLEIGYSLTESAILSLPRNGTPRPPCNCVFYQYLFDLPQEATATAFQDAEFLWNPNGHSPEGVYDAAHFDFGFFTSTRDERLQITPTNSDKWDKIFNLPSPEFVPEGFIPGPEAGIVGSVPTNGFFFGDPNSPEIQQQELTIGRLFTFYNGEILLYDLVVADHVFDETVNITEPLELPAAYSNSAYYPTSYSVTYDEANKEYRVAFGGMTFRSAATPTSVPELSPKWGLFAFGVWSAVSLQKKQRKKQKSTSQLGESNATCLT